MNPEITEPQENPWTPEDYKKHWANKVADLWIQFTEFGEVYITDPERKFSKQFHFLQYSNAVDVVEALEHLAFGDGSPIETNNYMVPCLIQSINADELFGCGPFILAKSKSPDYNLIEEIEELIDTRCEEMAGETV